VLGHIPYHGKLGLIVGVSTAVWVAVTLLTRPVEEEKLMRFVSHVRPGGPGWERVRRLMPDAPDGESLAASFAGWAYSSLFVVALTMGVGKTATAQALAALVGKGNWKLVVVAPGQVAPKWAREARTVLARFGISGVTPFW